MDDFEQFVRRHSPALFHTALLLCGNRHDAEELVQDTLARLLPKWDRVRQADSELAYVRRSLTNRFISARRAPAVRDASLWELPDGWDGRDLSESVAVSRTIWQLLGALPNRQRAALVMRHFHDLPDAEIAAALGCRVATVRSLTSRGLAALRAACLNSSDSEGSLR
jgi:RNA polymerase sigma-70 factor (sigma-E family)